MNSTIWLALALVLVLEGLGPMLYPKAWKKIDDLTFTFVTPLGAQYDDVVTHFSKSPFA